MGVSNQPTNPTTKPASSVSVWMLVDEATRQPLTLPATRKDFRGDESTIVDFWPPRSASSTGRVVASGDMGGGYYPSVFNLAIIEVPANAQPEASK